MQNGFDSQLLTMKYKITPLLVVSIVLILLGIYFILPTSDSNLAPLAGFLLVIAGISCLIPYFLLRTIFKTKIRVRIIIELCLLITGVFIYYQATEKIVLHVPHNFQGPILMIYGVDKKPELKAKHFFSRNIDITVPESGIIITSNKQGENIMIADSSEGKVKMMMPGYGIPFLTDTLQCGVNQYILNILVVGKRPVGWTPTTDTASWNLKKISACKMISE